jgi:hypothetical protein
MAAAIAAAAMILPAAARASDEMLPNPDALSLSPQVTHHDSDAAPEASETVAASKPLFLDAGAADQPNIHGFADVTFTTAYLTPRGLLVFDKGVVIQPIVGLVLPIGDLGPIKNYTWVAGVWNCITASQGDPDVGGWNEMDFFFSQSGTVADVVTLNLTYGEWNFPQSTVSGKPKAEQNLDLKIGYDDSKMWGDSGFSLNPYVDCWWAMAGSSTVTFGREGGTGYFEFGIVPTYTVKAIPDYPIKITVPSYFSCGPKDYWGRGGYIAGLSANSASNFGVATIAVNLDVPLSFIPAKYGHWHGDVGVSYDYLINGALLDAGTLLTGNTNRSLVEGSVGFGVNF